MFYQFFFYYSQLFIIIRLQFVGTISSWNTHTSPEIGRRLGVKYFITLEWAQNLVNLGLPACVFILVPLIAGLVIDDYLRDNTELMLMERSHVIHGFWGVQYRVSRVTLLVKVALPTKLKAFHLRQRPYNTIFLLIPYLVFEIQVSLFIVFRPLFLMKGASCFWRPRRYFVSIDFLLDCYFLNGYSTRRHYFWHFGVAEFVLTWDRWKIADTLLMLTFLLGLERSLTSFGRIVIRYREVLLNLEVIILTFVSLEGRVESVHLAKTGCVALGPVVGEVVISVSDRVLDLLNYARLVVFTHPVTIGLLLFIVTTETWQAQVL